MGGGRVVLVDLVASECEDQAESHNRLERLRDPSHTRALSITHLASLVGQSGLILEGKVATLPVDMDLENWLESTSTKNESRKEVRETLEIELGGGESTGMGGHKDANGRIYFTHNYALLIG